MKKIILIIFSLFFLANLSLFSKEEEWLHIPFSELDEKYGEVVNVSEKQITNNNKKVLIARENGVTILRPALIFKDLDIEFKHYNAENTDIKIPEAWKFVGSSNRYNNHTFASKQGLIRVFYKDKSDEIIEPNFKYISLEEYPEIELSSIDFCVNIPNTGQSVYLDEYGETKTNKDYNIYTALVSKDSKYLTIVRDSVELGDTISTFENSIVRFQEIELPKSFKVGEQIEQVKNVQINESMNIKIFQGNTYLQKPLMYCLGYTGAVGSTPNYGSTTINLDSLKQALDIKESVNLSHSFFFEFTTVDPMDYLQGQSDDIFAYDDGSIFFYNRYERKFERSYELENLLDKSEKEYITHSLWVHDNRKLNFMFTNKNRMISTEAKHPTLITSENTELIDIPRLDGDTEPLEFVGVFNYIEIKPSDWQERLYFITKKHGIYIRDLKAVFNNENNNIFDKLQLNSLIIFPNPTTDFTTISLDLLESGNIKIELCDIFGRTILDIFDGFYEETHFEQTISTSNLAKGIYYLKFQIGKDYKIEKIVVN